MRFVETTGVARRALERAGRSPLGAEEEARPSARRPPGSRIRLWPVGPRGGYRRRGRIARGPRPARGGGHGSAPPRRRGRARNPRGGRRARERERDAGGRRGRRRGGCARGRGDGRSPGAARGAAPGIGIRLQPVRRGGRPNRNGPRRGGSRRSPRLPRPPRLRPARSRRYRPAKPRWRRAARGRGETFCPPGRALPRRRTASATPPCSSTASPSRSPSSTSARRAPHRSWTSAGRPPPKPVRFSPLPLPASTRRDGISRTPATAGGPPRTSSRRSKPYAKPMSRRSMPWTSVPPRSRRRSPRARAAASPRAARSRPRESPRRGSSPTTSTPRAGFEKALDAALGSALEAPVLETRAALDAALASVREKRLGAARFVHPLPETPFPLKPKDPRVLGIARELLTAKSAGSTDLRAARRRRRRERGRCSRARGAAPRAHARDEGRRRRSGRGGRGRRYGGPRRGPLHGPARPRESRRGEGHASWRTWRRRMPRSALSPSRSERSPRRSTPLSPPKAPPSARIPRPRRRARPRTRKKSVPIQELRVLADEGDALRQDLAKAGESRAEAARLAAQRQSEMATVERTLSELETALDAARSARLTAAEADAAARNGRDVLIERSRSLADTSAAAEDRARDAARRVAEMADALVEIGRRRVQALAAGETARAAQGAAAIAAAECRPASYRDRRGSDVTARGTRHRRGAGRGRARSPRRRAASSLRGRARPRAPQGRPGSPRRAVPDRVRLPAGRAAGLREDRGGGSPRS